MSYFKWREYKERNETLVGYPVYPASEDIYSQYQEVSEINPEDITKIKELNDNFVVNNNGKDFIDDMSGSDLDIPGTESDNQQENSGIEDEENSYYSLGGDAHNDLEENTE